MKLGRFTCAFSLCLVAACGDLDDDVDAADPAGSLVIDWAVQGGNSETDCDDAGAVLVKVTIKSLHRNATHNFAGSCELASTTLSLYPDEYEGEATLEGRSGTLTRAVPLGTFSVSEGEVTSVSVDFTSDAFR